MLDVSVNLWVGQACHGCYRRHTSPTDEDCGRPPVVVFDIQFDDLDRPVHRLCSDCFAELVAKQVQALDNYKRDRERYRREHA